jgi:hypothetical protein
LDAVFAVYPIKRPEKVNHKGAHFRDGQYDGQTQGRFLAILGGVRPRNGPLDVQTDLEFLAPCSSSQQLLCAPARVYRDAKKNKGRGYVGS